MQKNIFSLLIAVLFAVTARSQDSLDIALLKRTSFYDAHPAYYTRAGNDQKVLQPHKKNVLTAANPLLLVMKGSMLLYQHIISPQLSRNCPYEITCSNFSKQAIHEYGIVKGVFISADRIMRCNRIALMDIHPLDINEQTGAIIDPINKYK